MVLKPEQIQAARNAIEHARAIRQHHARKTGKDDPYRRTDIRAALDLLKRAMRPIRKFLAVTQFEPDHPHRFEALNLSMLLQRERRKLWKLKQPAKHSDTAHHREVVEYEQAHARAARRFGYDYRKGAPTGRCPTCGTTAKLTLSCIQPTHTNTRGLRYDPSGEHYIQECHGCNNRRKADAS